MASRSQVYFSPGQGLNGVLIIVEDQQQIRGHILAEDFLLPAQTLSELADVLITPAKIDKCYIAYYSLRWTDWFPFDFQHLEVFSEAGNFFVSLHGHIEWDYDDDGVRTVSFRHHRLWLDG